jgi:DNA processing protein
VISASDPEAHVAALAGLPGMTTGRLSALLEGTHPVLAWRSVRAGKHSADPDRRFVASARATDVGTVEARYRRAGVRLLLRGRPDYPAALVEDPTAPAVLFCRGEPTVFDSFATVAIVGTRSATAYGRRVAAEMGVALAEEGVVVVSGLARGIDSAAHTGALRASGPEAARPAAVVGTGLDVVYPSSSAELWERVARLGVLVSESPLGTAPQPWVFPARNRIIAGLADVVVVVECHLSGGSLSTVEAAARRSVPVCVVPGSVHSPSSAGTNALLVDGCTPVRDATDVLVAVSLARAGRMPSRAGPRPSSLRRHSGNDGHGAVPVTVAAPHRATTEDQRTVLEAVDETPTVFETILLRTNLPIPEAAQACDELVDAGLLASGPGWWSRD